MSGFIPAYKLISSITNANPGVLTTTAPHGYQTGWTVRIYLPVNPARFGMWQLNDNLYEIVVLDTTSFQISVDTSNFDVFVSSANMQYAQVVPVGEPSNTLVAATENSGGIVPEVSWIER